MNDTIGNVWKKSLIMGQSEEKNLCDYVEEEMKDKDIQDIEETAHGWRERGQRRR